MQSDAELAVAIAQAGSHVVRSRFGTALERSDKGGGDFATNADLESESVMLDLLRRERPADGIVGEESGRSGSAGAPRVWFIDPLCGTLNYAAGMQVVAVNVALRVNGTFAAAAVADPFAREVYWADGRSAWRRTSDGDARLAPSGASKLVDLNFDPPFSHAPAFKAALLAADPGFASAFRPRVVSTSIALAWVATGQRAAYVTDGPVGDSVHFAAGLALCEAAGCVVSDLRGGSWGQGDTGLVAAADRETHDKLMSLIRKYVP